jgi:predicted phage baseplate assembly protein
VSFNISKQGISLVGADPTSLDEARNQAIGALKTRWRAITTEDFEELVLSQAEFNLARAKCLPELDLTSPGLYESNEGHVSIIIVPNVAGERPAPDQETIDKVWAMLDQRRLITCRHHVVGPSYTEVRVETRVVRDAQVLEDRLERQIQDNLRAFFHPLTGGPGPNPQGWPFGRDVYSSEVYQVIENTPGVDHAESLRLYTRGEGDNWADAQEQVAVPPNNLVHFVAQPGDIRMRVER